MIGEVVFFGVVPFMLLVTLILRESGNSSWLRDYRKPVLIGGFVVSMIGSASLMASNEARSEALLQSFAVGVYATVGVFILYLSYSFAQRVRHYYQLPNFEKTHRDSTGAFDIEQVVRDAPNPSSAKQQKAWVSRNQALRAADALAAINGESKRHLPSFLPPDPSRVRGARALVQAYTDYLLGVRDKVVSDAVEKATREYQSRS